MTGEARIDSSLPDDILARLASDFPNESTGELAAVLREYDGPERFRVIRCVVHIAAGNTHALVKNVESAAADYRDVIYWAEYDADGQRIKDYNNPFHAPQSVQPDRGDDAAPS